MSWFKHKVKEITIPNLHMERNYVPNIVYPNILEQCRKDLRSAMQYSKVKHGELLNTIRKDTNKLNSMEKIIIDGKEYERVKLTHAEIMLGSTLCRTHCNANRDTCKFLCGVGNVLKLKTNNMEDLTNAHGKYFSATIDGVDVIGRVSVSNRRYASNKQINLCNNAKGTNIASPTIDKFGYEYYKVVGLNDLPLSMPSNVTNFKLISNPTINPETYMDWKVGDRVRKEGSTQEIIVEGRLNDLVFTSRLSDDGRRVASGNIYLTKQLFEYGYRLDVPKVEPTITELTLEEVAKKFGKDVKDIRIKD